MLIFPVNGLSVFLDQQVRAVWDERMIKVRLEKGGAPEKMAKGLFGGLGEPPQQVTEENKEEIPGAFEFRHIPHESIEKLRAIDGVEEVQPEIWVMPRSMQVEVMTGSLMPSCVHGYGRTGYARLRTGFYIDQAQECIVSVSRGVGLRIPRI